MPTTVVSRNEFEQSLGEYLIGQSQVDASQLTRAERAKSENGDGLDVILVRLGIVAETDMAAARAALLNLPLIGAGDFPATAVLEDSLSTRFIHESNVIPLSDVGGQVALAMVDPTNEFAIHAVEIATGRRVLPRVALPADIEAAFSRLYSRGKTSIGKLVDALAEPNGQSADEDIERLRDLASEAPVVRLVNLLIERAVENRASDIHIEPFGNHLRVRYRIDGVLHEFESPPQNLQAATISRIKIMSKLNIAERRLPQDGRVRIPVRGRATLRPAVTSKLNSQPTCGKFISVKVRTNTKTRLSSFVGRSSPRV